MKEDQSTFEKTKTTLEQKLKRMELERNNLNEEVLSQAKYVDLIKKDFSEE